jgi:hypothetical protein
MTGFESNFFWIAQKVSVSEASKNSQISLPKEVNRSYYHI